MNNQFILPRDPISSPSRNLITLPPTLLAIPPIATVSNISTQPASVPRQNVPFNKWAQLTALREQAVDENGLTQQTRAAMAATPRKENQRGSSYAIELYRAPGGSDIPRDQLALAAKIDRSTLVHITELRKPTAGMKLLAEIPRNENETKIEYGRRLRREMPGFNSDDYVAVSKAPRSSLLDHPEFQAATSKVEEVLKKPQAKRQQGESLKAWGNRLMQTYKLDAADCSVICSEKVGKFRTISQTQKNKKINKSSAAPVPTLSFNIQQQALDISAIEYANNTPISSPASQQNPQSPQPVAGPSGWVDPRLTTRITRVNATPEDNRSLSSSVSSISLEDSAPAAKKGRIQKIIWSAEPERLPALLTQLRHERENNPARLVDWIDENRIMHFAVIGVLSEQAARMGAVVMFETTNALLYALAKNYSAKQDVFRTLFSNHELGLRFVNTLPLVLHLPAGLKSTDLLRELSYDKLIQAKIYEFLNEKYVADRPVIKITRSVIIFMDELKS